MNPVLIAVDKNSFNYIKRFHGVCLLCEKNNDFYDLSFCFEREVWVLYNREQKFLSAMQLARAIQLNGANKVMVITCSNHGE